jgi:plasmid stabilization system protein ParE
MKSVVFHPLAEQELLDAVSYYEEQEAGLGLEYLGEVEHAVNFLMRYPEAGAKITGAIRRLTLPKFPYSLLYRVLEDRIRVLAVAHHRRKPDYWIDRQ